MKRHPIPLLSGAALLLAATVASAATFRVNDTADAVDATPGDGICATAGGKCTLRAAVQEANTLAGADRIRVPAGTYLLTQAGFYPDDDASTGDLDLAGRVVVVGEGPGATIVDGNGIDRVFHVLSGARVRLTRLAVRGGVEPTNGSGGGILSAGARLTLKRLLIEDNEASIGGGLAAGLGTTRLVASTVRGNRAALGGGAVLRGGSTVTATTFDGNTASGIASFTGRDLSILGPGPLTIANSTITGQIQNVARCALADAILVGADVVLANVTVNEVSNVAIDDGCPPDPGTVTIRNTIVGACDAELLSQGYNFVQPEGCVILGDLTGVVVGDDPLLGSLKDNGGPTFTRLPVAVSAAVDGGNPATPGSGGLACEPFDQRGVPRYLGLGCDVGATEAH